MSEPKNQQTVGNHFAWSSSILYFTLLNFIPLFSFTPYPSYLPSLFSQSLFLSLFIFLICLSSKAWCKLRCDTNMSAGSGTHHHCAHTVNGAIRRHGGVRGVGGGTIMHLFSINAAHTAISTVAMSGIYSHSLSIKEKTSHDPPWPHTASPPFLIALSFFFLSFFNYFFLFFSYIFINLHLTF